MKKNLIGVTLGIAVTSALLLGCTDKRDDDCESAGLSGGISVMALSAKPGPGGGGSKSGGGSSYKKPGHKPGGGSPGKPGKPGKYKHKYDDIDCDDDD